MLKYNVHVPVANSELYILVPGYMTYIYTGEVTCLQCFSLCLYLIMLKPLKIHVSNLKLKRSLQIRYLRDRLLLMLFQASIAVSRCINTRRPDPGLVDVIDNHLAGVEHVQVPVRCERQCLRLV